ncbi:MAG: M43 family zinc metalloprotease [Bacteroidota bacterium]|nr:M43 family zinc metalloprotease [Bacteroidota bacterium]
MKITSTTALLFVSILGCLSIAPLAAQTQIPCGTSEVTDALHKKYPQLVAQKAQYEAELDAIITQNKNKKSAESVYIIPVVFHVLHIYGSQNIADAQIFAQMNRLNEDFRKLNADTSALVAGYDTVAADCKIEFRLAQLDPNGNCTNGIDRIYTHRTFQASDNSKPNQWPREKYLNIWVVNDIEGSGGGSTILGFAHFPSSVASFLYPFDGIVAIYNTVNGSSRTLTHEVGHWLNLNHTWGSGEINVACGDDGVNDTPPTKGHFSTCPLTDSSCTGGIIENVQNFMDYSSCTMMFSEGQKIRMRAALESNVSSRNNLWRGENLIATGTDGSGVACAPVPDFNANRYYVCAGSTVTFTKFTQNTLSTAGETYLWNFPGGTAPSLTAVSPTVTYTTPGWHDVTLQITNSAGSTTTTKAGFIYVSENYAQYTSVFTEDFENSSDFFNFWPVSNPDMNANTFGLSSSTGYSGTKSVKMGAYGNYRYDVDELITPSFNLDYLSSPTLTFRCAATSKASSAADINDELRLFYSNNCGQSWTPLGSMITDANLINNGFFGSDYTPSSPSAWKLHTINIPSGAQTDKVRFKFQYTSGSHSNNIYIDDVNINGIVGIEENTLEDGTFNLYPNPANQSCTVSYRLNESADTKLEVVDILGKTIMLAGFASQQAGDHTFSISKQKLNLNNGVYFVRLTSGNNIMTKKLIITE